MTPNQKEDLNCIRRTAERGKALAESTDSKEYLYLFIHIIDFCDRMEDLPREFAFRGLRFSDTI